MTTDNQDNELNELGRLLDLDETTAQQIARDIQSGDKLLAQHPEPQMPAELAERIEETLAVRLATQHVSPPNYWLRPLLATAATILILLSITAIWIVQPTEPTGTASEHVIAGNGLDLFEDELALLAVTLSLEKAEDKIDDIALEEASLFWDENEQILDNLSRKEAYYENYA